MNQIQLIHQSLLTKKKHELIKNKYFYFSVVLSPEFEEFVKSYAESVHDQWSYAKVNYLKKFFFCSNN